MRMPYTIFPQEVVEKYNLNKMVEKDGYVYFEIRKGIWGLPQVGILTNKLLQEKLKEHGYEPVELTPGLWKQKPDQ